MKVCPACKVRYSDNARYCSICGNNLVVEPEEEQEISKKGINITLLLKLGILIISILFIVGSILVYLSSGPSKHLTLYKQGKGENIEKSKKETQVSSEMTSDGYARLIKKVQPAIVTIHTFDRAGEEKSLGSGFLINDKGHLITNYHVLKDSYYAIIKFSDGKETKIYTDKAIGIDRKADLVKIHVKPTTPQINFLKIADSLPEVGERIVVVGSPLGLEQTVTDGVVSGVRQVDDLKFIQISAPISPGSSGGPVVNMKGEVVGVSTFILKGGQNLNFAIPASKILVLGEKEEDIQLANKDYNHHLFSQAKNLAPSA